MELNQKDIKPEHISQAFDMLQEYCTEKNINILKFVKDKANIPIASEEIHKRLPFAIRLFFKPNKIATMLNKNHDFIIDKAKEECKKRKIK